MIPRYCCRNGAPALDAEDGAPPRTSTWWSHQVPLKQSMLPSQIADTDAIVGKIRIKTKDQIGANYVRPLGRTKRPKVISDAGLT